QGSCVFDDQEQPKDQTVKVRIDGVDYDKGSDAHIQVLERKLGEAEKTAETEKTRADGLSKDLAKAEAQRDEAQAKLKEAPSDEARLDAELETRLEFRSQAARILGEDYEFKGKAPHAVRLDAIKAAGR